MRAAPHKHAAKRRPPPLAPDRQLTAREQQATNAPTRKHPGRVQITVAATSEDEKQIQFFTNTDERVLIELGKAVWVKPWVIDILRTCEIGVFVSDPNDPLKKRTVLKRRFPFAINRDPENLVTPELDEDDEINEQDQDLEA